MELEGGVEFVEWSWYFWSRVLPNRLIMSNEHSIAVVEISAYDQIIESSQNQIFNISFQIVQVESLHLHDGHFKYPLPRTNLEGT